VARPSLKSSSTQSIPSKRFGAGLTEAEVRRLQAILREQCGRDVALSEAWPRAIELLSLVEMLLGTSDKLPSDAALSTGFALPRS
jgi:hypothetical protein